MKFLTIFLAIIYTQSVVTAQSAVRLDQLDSVGDRQGSSELNTGYVGGLRFGRKAEADANDPRRTIELTHVMFARFDKRHDVLLPPEVFAAIVDSKTGKTVKIRFHARLLKRIPDLSKLRTFSTRKQFSDVLGPNQAGWPSGSIVEIAGRTTSRLPCAWNGCERRADGTLRIVSVYLIDVQTDGIASVELKEVDEAIFRPTGKRPVPELESAEPSHAPKLGLPGSTNGTSTVPAR